MKLRIEWQRKTQEKSGKRGKQVGCKAKEEGRTKRIIQEVKIVMETRTQHKTF